MVIRRDKLSVSCGFFVRRFKWATSVLLSKAGAPIVTVRQAQDFESILKFAADNKGALIGNIK
jgi:hypothetical protein